MKRLALFSIFTLLLSLAAMSQARKQQPSGAPRSGALRLTGNATNGTTNKPAAGDSVVLLKPGQSMEEVARAKVDAQGQFSLLIPEDGMPIHAIRIHHQDADFVKMVRQGESTIAITVYDTAPVVDGIRVTDQSEVFQTQGSTLMGVELFSIENNSNPPKAQPAFQFYLPDGATLRDGSTAFSGELIPVKRNPVALDEKNKYEMKYPVRPGMTRFEITYTLPYFDSLKIASKAAGNVDKFYVVVPQTMTFKDSGAGFHPERWPIEPDLAVATNAIDRPETGKQVAYELSGSGAFPDAPSQAANSGGGANSRQDNRPGGGMGIPNASPTPLDSSRLGFLGALTVSLIAGGLIVFFVNRQPVAPEPVMTMGRTSQDRSAALLEALKEEIFQLESERVKNKISQPDYDKAKAALDNTLQRAMKRRA
ncbi:MAG TPA: hypothetical protein VG759_22380 [Candidatus Angelobacter sp.]|nr:hypothetical protein [Candidatus Angelobacter sp.]